MEQKELVTNIRNFEEIRDYIEQSLKDEGLSTRVVNESMFVFEALYNDLMQQKLKKKTNIRVTVKRRFGETVIRFGYEGAIFVPMQESDIDDSPEAMVIKAYGDKIEHSYHGGYNNISITVRRTHSRSFAMCLAAILIAILLYGLLSAVLSSDTQAYVLANVIVPVENIFTNAVIMIAAPVTFFSLLKNFTDAYILSERSSMVRKLQINTIISSVICIMLSLGISFILQALIPSKKGIFEGLMHVNLNVGFADIIESLVPKDIFAPFETMAPFPLIILAALVTYSLCSIGNYFDILKKAIDVCYSLFSRMLTVIVYTLPFFSFMAVLDILFKFGFKLLFYELSFMVIVAISLCAVGVYYIVRLKIGGVSVKDFFAKLPPLLFENSRMSLSSEAVPFNVRYCTTKYGLDRKRTEESLPILAQINLDGNCFMITMVALMYMFFTGTGASWFDVVVILILVLFLSLGAPNQPGSFLVGLIIILSYLNEFGQVSMIILSEVFLGQILGLVNVTGDIVTVNIQDAAERGKEAKS